MSNQSSGIAGFNQAMNAQQAQAQADPDEVQQAIQQQMDDIAHAHNVHQGSLAEFPYQPGMLWNGLPSTNPFPAPFGAFGRPREGRGETGDEKQHPFYHARYSQPGWGSRGPTPETSLASGYKGDSESDSDSDSEMSTTKK